MTRRLLPEFVGEFGTQFCVHPHEVRRPPPGVELPLLVLVSNDKRVVAFQGYPSKEELNELARALLGNRSPNLQSFSR